MRKRFGTTKMYSAAALALFAAYSCYSTIDLLLVRNSSFNLIVFFVTLLFLIATVRFNRKNLTIGDPESRRPLGKVTTLLYSASLASIILFGRASIFSLLFILLQIFVMVTSGFHTYNGLYRYRLQQISLFMSSVYVTAFLLAKPSLLGGLFLLAFYASWTLHQLAIHYEVNWK